MKKIPQFDKIGMPLGPVRRRAFNEFNDMVYNGKIKLEKIEVCFCGSDKFQILSKYDRFGLPFGTQICQDCGLVTQTLRIAPDALPEFYDIIYWPLAEGREKPIYLTAPKKGEKLSFVFKYIPEDWREVVLFEIGCGSGERITKLKKELEDKGHNVTAIGCDYSKEALKLAQSKGIRTVNGGMDEIAAFGKADVLILSHVVEHMPDLKVALAQIQNLVKDHAIVYIEVPGIIDLENKIEYAYDYQDYNILVHTYNFSLTSLSNVLASGGFKLVEGDEFVRAVFKKTNDNNVVMKSSYAQTINALDRAHEKQLKYESKRNSPFNKYLRNLAKAILNKQDL